MMTTAPGKSAPPTRVRYSVLGLLCMLAMITYLDRAMYGSAKGDLMASVGQPESQFFIILVAFQLAYALFEIPAGWMGDTFGPRVTLLRIVAWWSLFVALTGFAGMSFGSSGFVPIGFTVLVLMQFLFGMGEAGAFPNITKAIYNWFPENQRGFAKGAIWMSARFAGGLTPAIWVLLVGIIGLDWREALWCFAGLAAFWCAVFMLAFRNRPDEHPAVNEAEVAKINAGKVTADSHSGVPWKAIFSSRNVWALCLMYTVTNFNWYFLMYYVPGTLKSQFPAWNATDGGKLLLALLGGAPLLVGMFGCLFGGMLTDRYIRRTGDRKWGRRIFGMLGYGLAGVCYLCAAGARVYDPANLWLFAGCLIAVGFTNDLMLATAWATAQDIGRRYSAIVSGAMNMIGNLGAALGNLITGLILAAHTVERKSMPSGETLEMTPGTFESVATVVGGSVYPIESVVLTSGYVVCFVLFALVYGLGVVLWLLIDPTKPVPLPEDGGDTHAVAGANSGG